MKTADLQGALLDFWTARAEGAPADQLEIREMPRPGDPRTPDTICVRFAAEYSAHTMLRWNPSEAWHQGGPLITKYKLDVYPDEADGWCAGRFVAGVMEELQPAPNPLIAICRAVVRAAFGDEVEDLP